MSKKKQKLKNKKSVKVAALTKNKPAKPLDKKVLFGGLAALVITFLCFAPTFDYGFVTWDDDRNIYKNDNITSLNEENFWENTAKIWSSTVIGNYNPLSIWTFAVEKMTYGLEDLGKWHLTNILLHLICVLLVLKIALLLGLSWRGALFVTLLFGIHPMRVESVAWLTERKDVLYGAFYLAALWLYIKGKIYNKKYTIWIYLLFILSLFSKIQAVVLPISLILVDYYFDKKLSVKSIVSKVPMLLISLAFGLLGIYFLSDEGSITSNNNTYESWQRIFVGTYSYVIYLIKAVVPYEMSPLYPYPARFPWYFYLSFLIFPTVLFGLWKAYKSEHKVVFFGLGFFSVNIFFLLQVLGAGQGFLADRFTYIAYLGLFFIAGYGLDYLLTNFISKQALITGVAGVLVAIFSFMSFQQVQIWENSDKLWSHVIKYYKNSTLPWGNRANYLRDEGRITEALRDYSQSINLNPNGHQAYNSRARLYFNIAKGRDTLMMALRDYNKAIELAPSDGEFYVNRGATHARLGQVEKAITDISKGLELKPDHSVGYLNRFVMYNSIGQDAKALADIESYLRLQPYEANMWYEKARKLRVLRRVPEGVKALDRAIELNNENGLYWYERAKTKASIRDMAGAKSDLGRAIGLKYDQIDPVFRQTLGM